MKNQSLLTPIKGEPLPPIQGTITWSEEEIQRALLRAKKLAPRLYQMLTAEVVDSEDSADPLSYANKRKP